MRKQSAGLIVYRTGSGKIEVLIAHMGSPWWAKKDKGAWTIPKGEINENEEPFDAAQREFIEELGLPVPEGKFIDLGSIKQHNNKDVQAWAIEAEPDISKIKSNSVAIEWPPRSGQMQDFPEIDRAGWFSLPVAAQKTVRGQAELFERLAGELNITFEEPGPPADNQASLF